jgi:hypothetical protein
MIRKKRAMRNFLSLLITLLLFYVFFGGSASAGFLDKFKTTPEVNKMIKEYGLDKDQICRDNELLLLNDGSCNKLNVIKKEHVEYSLTLKNDLVKKQETLKNDSYIKNHGTTKDKYEKCILAGYTNLQMKQNSYECMQIDDLVPYMSSSTYSGITLGKPLTNFPYLRSAKDNYEQNIFDSFLGFGNKVENMIRVDSFDGPIYCGNKSPDESFNTCVVTRFGLVDMVRVNLGDLTNSTEDIDKVLGVLNKKYSLYKDKEYYSYYQGWKVNGSLWQFKNGEDDILYITDGMYRSQMIYKSSAYNIIDMFTSESINSKKSEEKENNNSILNDL